LLAEDQDKLERVNNRDRWRTMWPKPLRLISGGKRDDLEDPEWE
jgi:hypothetical protein